MTGREYPETIRAFFDAMNAQDADAAAALVSDDVTVEIGPHRLSGRSAVRELALQTDDQLAFETALVELETETETGIDVRARRTQRWRSTGEIAAEEELRASFTFDDGGAISRIVLA